MFPRKAYAAGSPEPNESPIVGWGEARTPALLGTATQASAVGVRFAHPNLPYWARIDALRNETPVMKENSAEIVRTMRDERD